MQRPVPFIQRVRLMNFRSIAACDVALSPLTVLVGPNGSGKSNFLDAIAFLARALDANLDAAVGERGGLPEFLCRVPGPADSFSVDVDVQLPWGDGTATGRYGFEIGRHEGTSFQVVREDCVLRWNGTVRQWRRDREAVRLGAGAPFAVRELDRLYLPVAATQLPAEGTDEQAPSSVIPTPFAALASGLARMMFYSFDLDELRRPRRRSPGADLGRRGEHLADVFEALGRRTGSHRDRLNAYLSAILRSSLPKGVRLEQWFSGPLDERGYALVQLHSPVGAGDREVVFDAHAMSDGTVRAAGVLAALFQPAVLDGRIPLVGIEEPETALHPAAAGVLYDVLTEASAHVQVVATSQSSDLLDRDDLDVSAIRSVSMEKGITRIGHIDAASKEIVASRLYTLGELMRGNQIMPDSPPSDADIDEVP